MLRYSPVNQPLPNLPWNRKEGEEEVEFFTMLGFVSQRAGMPDKQST